MPANIAEGRGRCSDAEFCRFLYMASGSIAELETFLELSARLGYWSPQALGCTRTATGEVGRMLYGLINTVRGDTAGRQGHAEGTVSPKHGFGPCPSQGGE